MVARWTLGRVDSRPARPLRGGHPGAPLSPPRRTSCYRAQGSSRACFHEAACRSLVVALVNWQKLCVDVILINCKMGCGVGVDCDKQRHLEFWDACMEG